MLGHASNNKKDVRGGRTSSYLQKAFWITPVFCAWEAGARDVIKQMLQPWNEDGVGDGAYELHELCSPPDSNILVASIVSEDTFSITYVVVIDTLQWRIKGHWTI